MSNFFEIRSPNFFIIVNDEKIDVEGFLNAALIASVAAVEVGQEQAVEITTAAGEKFYFNGTLVAFFDEFLE